MIRTKGGILVPQTNLLVARTPKLVSLENYIDQNYTQLKRSKFLGLKKENTIYVPNEYAPRKSLTGIGKKVAIALLSLSPILTGVNCKKSKKPIPTNYPPTFITETIPNAKENSPYSTTITAEDPENDSITYSITNGTADVFLAINPSTGELTNDTNITDIESGINHTLTVKAEDDKGNSIEKTFLLYVINTENVTGNIKDVTNDTNLQGMQVKLGTNSILTDAGGNYTLTNVEDNTYQMEINDNTRNEDNYYTYKPNNLIVSKQKNLEGKLTNISLKLAPISYDLLFFNETCRSYDGSNYVGTGNGKTQRISDEDCATWRFYIDTNPAFDSGNTVTQSMIDIETNIIENDWLEMTDGKLNINRLNLRLRIGTNPPAYGTLGYSIHRWNDTLIGGHFEYLNGDELISTYSLTNTTADLSTYAHENMQTLGARWDSGGADSVLSNSPPFPSFYTQLDRDTIRLLYNLAIGNRDLGTTHNHFVNPSDYIINP